MKAALRHLRAYVQRAVFFHELLHWVQQHLAGIFAPSGNRFASCDGALGGTGDLCREITVRLIVLDRSKRSLVGLILAVRTLECSTCHRSCLLITTGAILTRLELASASADGNKASFHRKGMRS